MAKYEVGQRVKVAFLRSPEKGYNKTGTIIEVNLYDSYIVRLDGLIDGRVLSTAFDVDDLAPLEEQTGNSLS